MQRQVDRKLRETWANHSVIVVASTGRDVEVVELVDDSAGVWTMVIGVSGTSSAGRGMGSIVAEAVQEHGSPATGDMLPPGPIEFALEHCASLEEVHIVVHCVLPSDFKAARSRRRLRSLGPLP